MAQQPPPAPAGLLAKLAAIAADPPAVPARIAAHPFYAPSTVRAPQRRKPNL
jgi:hypothetical protein